MRRSRLFRHIYGVAPAVLLGAWLAAGETGRAARPDLAPGPDRSPMRPTVEPLPGVEVAVDLDSLQKGTKGGVATLLLRVRTDLDLAEAALSAKAPAGLVFADGSSARTWKVKLAADGEQTIPVDVIANGDGAFDVSVELEGTTGGKPIRRGAAYELLVGVEKRAPKVQDGAIEFQASPAGDV